MVAPRERALNLVDSDAVVGPLTSAGLTPVYRGWWLAKRACIHLQHVVFTSYSRLYFVQGTRCTVV